MNSIKRSLVVAVLALWCGEARSADYEQVCKLRYREAIRQILPVVQAFNEGAMTAPSFLAYFTGIEAEIGALRVACTLESDETRACVLKYKAQYKRIRDEIDVYAIANRMQTEVRPGALWIEASLAMIDLQCL